MTSISDRIRLEGEGFNRAWLLLKTQPLGMEFTSDEKQFILTTIMKMMTSGDMLMEEEAEMLFNQYTRL